MRDVTDVGIIIFWYGIVKKFVTIKIITGKNPTYAQAQIKLFAHNTVLCES